MTNVYTIAVKEAVTGRNSFRFEGLVDAKGRELGCRTTWTEVTLEPMPEGHRGCFYTMEPGFWIGVQIHAQKDGEDFGAWTAPRHFRTMEEAQNYAEKRYDAMRKRAVK